jgi:hydrogenase maturation protease
MTDSRRRVVLGLGNTIFQDEGVGIHAVHALEERLGAASAEVEFVDGGVLGLNLLPLIEDCEYLLLLDAINADKVPGTVIEWDGKAIPLYAGVKMSEHQVTFQEVLGLCLLRDRLPAHLHLIGIQPLEMSVSLEPTPLVAQKVPEIVDRAVAILQAWSLIHR